MRIYSRMFSQEHSHTFTYFGATSVFTGCSNLDLVAVFLWRDKTKEEERNKDVIPTLWRAAKNASTVMVSCPVPVSCSSNTPMWMMQVRANPQWLSINFHCQHDLRVYSNKKWIVVVYDKDKKKKEEKINFCCHLLSLLHFQKALVSPEPASENQRLSAAISPSAHQRCNGNKTIRHKPKNRGRDKSYLLINWVIENYLERYYGLYFKWGIRHLQHHFKIPSQVQSQPKTNTVLERSSIIQ